MIVGDHEQLNSALHDLAQVRGVQLTSNMDRAHKATISKLQPLSGQAFDKAFLAEVTRINREDKSDLSQEVRSTKDPQVKQFAEQMQDADGKHEAVAKLIHQG